MKKKFVTTVLLISFVFVVTLSSPKPAHAQFLPFAGLASFSLPCTCSATLWIWFTPLYLGGPAILTGPMIYSPFSTIPFAYYHFGLPGIWHLGSYIPAIPACWMFAGVGCFPLPAIGLMFLVGTNRYI